MFGLNRNINNRIKSGVANNMIVLWKVIGYIGLLGCAFLDYKFLVFTYKTIQVLYSGVNDLLTGFLMTITFGVIPIIVFVFAFEIIFIINSIFIFLAFDL